MMNCQLIHNNNHWIPQEILIKHHFSQIGKTEYFRKKSIHTEKKVFQDLQNMQKIS
jgi:hypothetical protein